MFHTRPLNPFILSHMPFTSYTSPNTTHENVWSSATNTATEEPIVKPVNIGSGLILHTGFTSDSFSMCYKYKYKKINTHQLMKKNNNPWTLTQLDCYARVWAEPAFSASAERTSWKILLVTRRLYLTHMWCNCFFYYNPDRGNGAGRQDMDPSRKRLNLQ